MSENVLRVSLSEMDILRVTCRKCGNVVEVKADAAPRAVNGRCCKFCNEPLFDPEPDRGDNPLTRLSMAMFALREMEKKAGIEFVVTAPPPTR